MSNSLSDQEPPSLRRRVGMLVSLCIALNIVARGLTECFTAFLLPLTEHFQAERASVAAIYSLTMLTSGIGAPLAGYCFDRFGPLKLYLAGVFALTVGLLLASQASTLWELYLYIGLGVGLAAAALGNAPHSALLARWFEGPRLSQAMSGVYAGLGIGSLLVVPLSQWLIVHYGWRWAYLGLCLLVLLVLPALRLVDWRHAQAGSPAWNQSRRPAAARLPAANGEYASDRSIGEAAAPEVEWTLFSAMRTPAFWGLASVFFFTGSGLFSVMVQAVAYMVELGFPALTAASIYGLVGLLTPIGIVAFSWADGRIGRHASAAISYTFSLCGLFALWAMQWSQSVFVVAVFVLGIGLSFGARGPMVGATAARIFKGRRLGHIFGTIMLGSGLGIAFGTFAGASLHDLTGGYTAVFAYSAVSVLLGAMPFWTYRALREAA